MRRLRLDETTDTYNETTETLWDDWNLMRQLRLDEKTKTWWDDWDLMRRLRLMRQPRLDEMTETDETTGTWCDNWESESAFRLTTLNYLILNEIISSDDQDANHSKRFTLEEFGAFLNFIAVCSIQYFLFVDIWTFSWNCFKIFKKQRQWDDCDFMSRLRMMWWLKIVETAEN